MSLDLRVISVAFYRFFSELLRQITCNTFGILSSEDACKHKQYLHVHEL